LVLKQLRAEEEKRQDARVCGFKIFRNTTEQYQLFLVLVFHYGENPI
jgi:hypothetical protein